MTRAEAIAGRRSHAQWAVAAMIGLIVTRLHEVIPGLLHLKLPLIVGTLGTVVCVREAGRASVQRALSVPVLQLMLAYCVWAVIGIPFALWRGGAIDVSYALIPPLLVMLCLSIQPATPQALRFVQAAWVIQVTILAVAIFRKGIQYKPGRYTVSHSLDPNDLAALFAITIPMAVGLATKSRSGARWLWYLTAALMVMGSVRTGSRGGFLALVAGLVAPIALMTPRRRMQALTVAFAASIGMATFAPASYKERIAAVFSGEKDYNYDAYGGRLQIWSRATVHLARNPLFGVGVGQYSVAEGELMVKMNRGGFWYTAHNAYIQAVVETGVPGGMLWVFTLMGIVWVARRQALRRSGPVIAASLCPELLGSIAAFGVGSMFLSLANWWGLFALVGFATLAEIIRLEVLRGMRRQVPSDAARAKPTLQYLGVRSRAPATLSSTNRKNGNE